MITSGITSGIVLRHVRTMERDDAEAHLRNILARHESEGGSPSDAEAIAVRDALGHLQTIRFRSEPVAMTTREVYA